MKFTHFAIAAVVLAVAGGVCGDAGFVKTESALHASAGIAAFITLLKFITSDPE